MTDVRISLQCGLTQRATTMFTIDIVSSEKDYDKITITRIADHWDIYGITEMQLVPTRNYAEKKIVEHVCRVITD